MNAEEVKISIGNPAMMQAKYAARLQYAAAVDAGKMTYEEGDDAGFRMYVAQLEQQAAAQRQAALMNASAALIAAGTQPAPLTPAPMPNLLPQRTTCSRNGLNGSVTCQTQ
jgi:hypothetical protein